MQYLIAHKVRGEPTFDTAEKMEVGDEEWWITNYGHRAYPYWHMALINVNFIDYENLLHNILQSCPTDLPEHFEVSAAPKGKGIAKIGREVLEKLGLIKPTEPAQSLKRRSW